MAERVLGASLDRAGRRTPSRARPGEALFGRGAAGWACACPVLTPTNRDRRSPPRRRPTSQTRPAKPTRGPARFGPAPCRIAGWPSAVPGHRLTEVFRKWSAGVPDTLAVSLTPDPADVEPRPARKRTTGGRGDALDGGLRRRA